MDNGTSIKHGPSIVSEHTLTRKWASGVACQRMGSFRPNTGNPPPRGQPGSGEFSKPGTDAGHCELALQLSDAVAPPGNSVNSIF